MEGEYSSWYLKSNNLNPQPPQAIQIQKANTAMKEKPELKS